MICKNCGYKNEEDAKFCEQCGSQIKQKKKKSKIKKIILSVLSVIVVIVLAYVSRSWFVTIAFNNLLDSNIDYNVHLYDDYIDVDMTDINLESCVFKFVEIDADLDICDKNTSYDNKGNHYSFTGLLSMDKSNIYISGATVNYIEKVSASECFGSLVEMNNINLEDGKKYKCYLELIIRPKHPKNRNLLMLFSKIDNVLGIHGYFDCYEAYFLYENGEFIKVNE